MTKIPMEDARNHGTLLEQQQLLQQQQQQIKRTADALIRRKVLLNMAAGVGILAIPISAWWLWARRERQTIRDALASRIQLPAAMAASTMDTYDYIITEKVQAGDIILFDRRCERCAASPWAALACLISKNCLSPSSSSSSGGYGNNMASSSLNRYDHVGLIVPGYVHKRSDAFDPTNLLLLEATASGIVARPLKERLEQSASQSILLLQLACPGEQRSTSRQSAEQGNSSSTLASVTRTRAHVERELQRFRDAWINNASVSQKYAAVHSTITLGGALMYRVLGAKSTTTAASSIPFLNGASVMVVHPASYLVVTGLQAAAAAAVVSDTESRAVKPTDYFRDYRTTEHDVVRLRPGWRFLPPIPLKQSSSFTSR